MTWDELKEKVDEYLKSEGLDGKIPIWFIDISWPDDPFTIKISASNEFKDSHLVIM